MYPLAAVFPWVQRLGRLPVTRDQIMLLMMAFNEFFLGFDTFLAHSISGAPLRYEWIPIIFGPVAGVLLLVAGAIALRNRPLATVLANGVFVSSAIVGLLGAYFHLHRIVEPAAPGGQQATIDMFVWGPPTLGPLTFALVGLLGLSAVWIENPPDSGVLALLGARRLHMPYPKTQAYFLIVGMGVLATVLSSVLDHARSGFVNPWLWVPTVAGVFGVAVPVIVGLIDRPTRADLATYFGTMILLIVVGVVGGVLHLQFDLTAENAVVVERFLRGAPSFAPLLFSNMGALGLIAMLDPVELR